MSLRWIRILLVVMLAAVSAPAASSAGSKPEPDGDFGTGVWPANIAGAAVPERLTLKDCEDLALGKNPLLKAGLAGIAAAREQARDARSLYFPQFMFGSGYSRWERHAFLPSGLSFPGMPATIGPTGDWYLRFSGRWVLFDSGSRRAGWSGARAQLGVISAESEKLRQEVMLQVHRAFYRLAAAQELEEAARKSRDRAEARLHMARVRKEAGAVPLVDVLRAQSSLAGAKLELAGAGKSVRLAAAALNTAMGRSAETGIQIDVVFELPGCPAEAELPAWFEAAIRQRPEMTSARQQQEVARHAVKSARSAFGPRVTMDAQGGWHDNEFIPRDQEWAWGVTVEIPVFTGFSLQSRLARAKAEQARQDANTDLTALNLRQEVYSAWINLTESFTALELAEEQLRESGEGARLTRERYQAGAATINDLLDAEAVLAQAEAGRASYRWRCRTAYSELQRSAGRLGQD